MLRILPELVRNAAAPKTVGITHFHDVSIYISSEEGILYMIRAAGAFVMDEHKLVRFHTNYFYRHDRELLNQLQNHHLERDEGEFTTFALLLHTKFQKTKIVSH